MGTSLKILLQEMSVLFLLLLSLLDIGTGCHLTDIEYQWSLGIGSCYERNTVYQSKQTVSHQTSNFKDCQKLCAQHKKGICKFFSYKWDRSCILLFNDIINKTSMWKAISGPKICP